MRLPHRTETWQCLLPTIPCTIANVWRTLMQFTAGHAQKFAYTGARRDTAAEKNAPDFAPRLLCSVTDKSGPFTPTKAGVYGLGESHAPTSRLTCTERWSNGVTMQYSRLVAGEVNVLPSTSAQRLKVQRFAFLRTNESHRLAAGCRALGAEPGQSKSRRYTSSAASAKRNCWITYGR
jgi:hypothetical protein